MDTSVINGYETMSAEEKLKALEEYEIPKPDYSGYVAKSTFDKTAGELADAKKKIRETMSETEQKELERAEEYERMKNRIMELETNEKTANLVAQYTALGYNAELAKDTAKAFIKGDTDTVFKNQQTFIEEQKKAYKTELMKGTPTPPTGTIGSVEADYLKKSEEAQKNGNMQEAAYFLRLSQQKK